MRKALELALEALEDRTSLMKWQIARDAVKEALAQPEHEWVRGECVKCGQSMEQPEQEPVATLDDLEQEIYENTRQFVSRDVMEWMLKRYYATPPQRKPLTEQEIYSVLENLQIMYNRPPTTDSRIIFTRAIEAAHGIKE